MEATTQLTIRELTCSLMSSIYEHKHVAGRDTQMNMAMTIGDVKVKIAVTADHMIFRMEMEYDYWSEQNKRHISCKLSSGERLFMKDGGTSKYDPSIDLHKLFDEIDFINKTLKDCVAQ